MELLGGIRISILVAELTFNFTRLKQKKSWVIFSCGERSVRDTMRSEDKQHDIISRFEAIISFQRDGTSLTCSATFESKEQWIIDWQISFENRKLFWQDDANFMSKEKMNRGYWIDCVRGMSRSKYWKLKRTQDDDELRIFSVSSWVERVCELNKYTYLVINKQAFQFTKISVGFVDSTLVNCTCGVVGLFKEYYAVINFVSFANWLTCKTEWE